MIRLRSAPSRRTASSRIAATRHLPARRAGTGGHHGDDQPHGIRGHDGAGLRTSEAPDMSRPKRPKRTRISCARAKPATSPPSSR